MSGILVSIGINDNSFISGILNYIPSPSNLWYAAKKAREDTSIRIPWIVCNYPCNMSCNEGERAGLDRLVKDISLWDGEQVQLIRLDENESKGIS